MYAYDDSLTVLLLDTCVAMTNESGHPVSRCLCLPARWLCCRCAACCAAIEWQGKLRYAMPMQSVQRVHWAAPTLGMS